MKNKASESNEQPRKIVHYATATVTRQCAAALPKYKSLAESIQRQREWGNNPTTLKDVTIPLVLQFTLRRENFLAYDSGSDDRERFLVFSTEHNLDLFDATPQWHAAETFKNCSAFFYQLYTVYCVLNGHTIPLVYMLLKRKRNELYLQVLAELKENPCLQLSQITIDFEIACLLAFQELFPKVSMKNEKSSNPFVNHSIIFFQKVLVVFCSLLFSLRASRLVQSIRSWTWRSIRLRIEN